MQNPNIFPDTINHSINIAKTWLLNRKSKSSWEFPVINSSYIATALSIYVLTGEKKVSATHYLLENKVWEKCLIAAEIFGIALQETGEEFLAKEVFINCQNEIKKKGTDKRIIFKEQLKNVKLTYSFNLSENEISLIPLYGIFFKLSPEKIWYDRTSFFYQFFHETALLLLSKKDAKINKKIINVMKKALNSDGSYGGLTVCTIRAAYILKQLNEEELASKSIEWIEKTISEDGGLRPILWQDVYDTAWCSLALANSGENIDDIICWLNKTHIGDGYPYVSNSYFPDPDDTPLVLLAKIISNNLDTTDYKTVDFLIKCQKSNGGWTWSPFLEGIVKKKLLTIVGILFNSICIFICRYRKGYGFLSRAYSHQSFRPSIDITSRVLITLSYFKGRKNAAKAIKKGLNFLLNNYSNGRFRASRLYTSSHIYETSMALIALYKNDIKNEATEEALSWLLEQDLESAEDAAHILWALIEGNYDRTRSDKLIDFIISKQLPDGSWEFKVGFLANLQYYYSLFSIAAPLYALTLYRNKYRD
ncbi:prenyltransferase/squalene oxidase repeat-containing protein [Candidatus Methanoperedens nitratireducens]|uniref:Prenyltransferase alpha-alpha toroid domain-containing protein n=1 Tax=Candidatus Methanoperedens nitratireducens TaxID=1392998 RepID=A0A284VTK8_9EURY|nr:prenyltransferase/squalene oxidase repeat-containing protein [Candidatus Methanoperedens nitroreducens]SNQ62528.1 hypothetical protein MNV_760014 [Candidatus Methanoperedens nitroreducens]